MGPTCHLSTSLPPLSLSCAIAAWTQIPPTGTKGHCHTDGAADPRLSLLLSAASLRRHNAPPTAAITTAHHISLPLFFPAWPRSALSLPPRRRSLGCALPSYLAQDLVHRYEETGSDCARKFCWSCRRCCSSSMAR